MAALGWIGLTWPEEFGGQRPTADRPADRRRGADRCRRADRGDVVRRSSDGTVADRLRAARSASRRSCPGCCRARRRGASACPNRTPGPTSHRSDASAVRDGDEFVINGQKIWTSFGAVADYIYLICRTSNDGPPHAGHQRGRRADAHSRDRGPADHRHDHQSSLLRGLLHRRPRAGRATWSASRAGRSSRPCGQLEHERGGIDRLVSNHALYRMAVERADTSDPTRPPADRGARDRLPDRADPGRPRGARSGAEGLLGRDQVLLHRARVARRRVRRRRCSAPR